MEARRVRGASTAPELPMVLQSPAYVSRPAREGVDQGDGQGLLAGEGEV
jgi:hypothetical protein